MLDNILVDLQKIIKRGKSVRDSELGISNLDFRKVNSIVRETNLDVFIFDPNENLPTNLPAHKHPQAELVWNMSSYHAAILVILLLDPEGKVIKRITLDSKKYLYLIKPNAPHQIINSYALFSIITTAKHDIDSLNRVIIGVPIKGASFFYTSSCSFLSNHEGYNSFTDLL